MEIPFTRLILKEWAGWKAFRDGKMLFERGVVEKVEYDHPLVWGELAVGIRGMRSRFELLPDGFVENHCPCRENRERGLICSHLVALGLELLKQRLDPTRELKSLEEARRALRLEQFDEADYITRVPETHPEGTPAVLRFELGKGWKKTEKTPLYCLAEYNGKSVPLNEVPRKKPFSFSPRDENLLYVLEDISEGPANGRLEVSSADFQNLLHLLEGRPIYEEGREEPYALAETPVSSHMAMELDRETGELILSVHPEFPGRNSTPVFIISRREGWVFGRRAFWRLETLLPEPLHAVYRAPIRIERAVVPNFIQNELSVLHTLLRVETQITPDLFTLDPATPRFRLVVSGSRASLSAKLYAEYGDLALLACRDETSGNFAQPNPEDLLDYSVRNPEAEKKALEQLASTGFRGRRGDLLTSIIGPREVLNFLGGAIPKLRRAGWRVELEGRIALFLDEAEFTTPVVHIHESGADGFFDVGYEYDNTGGQSLSEADIQRALLKGEAFVERGGRTVLLDIDAIETAREVFNDCACGAGAAPGTFRLNNIYAAYVESSLGLLDGVDLEVSPDWMEHARIQNRAERVEKIELGSLGDTLRSYQKEGVYWLRFLERSGFSGILADEMGLGKTVQALTWLQLTRSRETARNKPSLIVCPTSLVDNWGEEAAKFTPNLCVLRLHGIARHDQINRMAEFDLVITSYALLRRDLDHHLQHEFAAILLDEAQHIKNRATQNAQAAKKLRGAHRLVLTGTPVENSVADLWSIMDFLMPGYLSNHRAFREHYELPIAGGGPEGELAQLKLRRKLHPFLMRRLKKEVAKDLPDKIQRTAFTTLSKDQHMVYRQLLESAKRKINDMVETQGFNKSRMQILKTLLRLRQTCCHLDLLKLPGLNSEYPSAKMELFFELLNEALDGGHRILVFSQFTSMLAILRREMEKRGLKYCYLDGATKDRQEIVREFNINRQIPVFLMSLKAGGTGLNLTGADMVIHFDPWWNPAVEDQATDRAHRIGQKNTVYSIKLITKDTVEEKVLAMQKRKQSVIDATLTKDGDISGSLNWQDVQELLSL